MRRRNFFKTIGVVASMILLPDKKPKRAVAMSPAFAMPYGQPNLDGIIDVRIGNVPIEQVVTYPADITFQGWLEDQAPEIRTKIIGTPETENFFIYGS